MKIGQKLRCTAIFIQTDIKCPVVGWVYTLRAFHPISVEYILLEEIVNPPYGIGGMETGFSLPSFERVRVATDFSDILSPRLKWEREE